jgi:acyl dehydratase
MSTADRYIEDIQVGEAWTSRPVHISAEDIVEFGFRYDPQPMHTDAEAAARGPFGGLIASGWQIAALAMRLSVEAKVFGNTPIIGSGVDELRWVKPVRAGDTLTMTREITRVELPRKPRSRGTVHSTMVVRNQNDEDVLTMKVSAKVPPRPLAA